MHGLAMTYQIRQIIVNRQGDIQILNFLFVNVSLQDLTPLVSLQDLTPLVDPIGVLKRYDIFSPIEKLLTIFSLTTKCITWPTQFVASTWIVLKKD
jgi:hypothetical protein